MCVCVCVTERRYRLMFLVSRCCMGSAMAARTTPFPRAQLGSAPARGMRCLDPFQQVRIGQVRLSDVTVCKAEAATPHFESEIDGYRYVESHNLTRPKSNQRSHSQPVPKKKKKVPRTVIALRVRKRKRLKLDCASVCVCLLFREMVTVRNNNKTALFERPRSGPISRKRALQCAAVCCSVL